MLNLKNFLSENKGETLLIVFPHPDDESFVAGGLLQLVKHMGIKTKLITLTNGEHNENNTLRETEYKKAVNLLGIDIFEIWKYKEGELNDLKEDWTNKLKKEIKNTKPFAVLTFDPNGITGHPDHIVTSVSILNLIKKVKEAKPHLLWRISDIEEKKYFYGEKGLVVEKTPTFSYNLSLVESIRKLKAIFTYKSQFKNIFFRLRVLDWYLFDHKELFYLADFKKDNFEVLLEKET